MGLLVGESFLPPGKSNTETGASQRGEMHECGPVKLLQEAFVAAKRALSPALDMILQFEIGELVGISYGWGE